MAKENTRLAAFAPLLGDWLTTGKHPHLPGRTLRGRVSFERIAKVMGPGYPTPYNVVVSSTTRPITDPALLRELDVRLDAHSDDRDRMAAEEAVERCKAGSGGVGVPVHERQVVFDELK